MKQQPRQNETEHTQKNYRRVKGDGLLIDL